MKANEIISLGASCTALVCSLIALFHILPRELELDYLGVIVGILSFLITLLLGWNIYTVVDFKSKIEFMDSRRKELESIIKNYHSKEKEQTGFISDALSDIYLGVLDCKTTEGKECNYLLYKVHSLYSYDYIGRIENCNRIVAEMLVFLLEGKGKNVDSSTCETVLEILENLRNKERICNLHTLRKTLQKHIP